MRLLLTLFLAAGLHAQKFYPDDPLLVEPPPLDAGKPAVRKLADIYDLFWHVLKTPGEKQPEKGPPIKARAVNTLGDPMDGAWYSRRHYWFPMTPDQLRRGAGGNLPPAVPWTVVSAKAEGITPGFTINDANKRTYFIKLDPITNPEMMTSADVIGARFFHAAGYHVPDNYITTFRREDLTIGEKVQFTNTRGRKQDLRPRDLTEFLLKAPRNQDGSYRAVASLVLEGTNIGPFRWFGQRTDDPNDTVPHEHRRDLRALHVFAAWLGHDDSRSINTIDTAVSRDGKTFVRHHLIDFGSVLGSASDGPNSPRSGDYLYSFHDSAIQFASLGLVVPYWAKAHYPDYPAIGRFESKVFDPERWLPEYPNPAFLNRLPDDEFWAAKQVMNFSDDDIRAIVSTGRISDPKQENYLIACLIERRDKIGRAFFRKVLPIDRFEIRAGELTFTDLSARHGFGPAGPFNIEWHEFNNTTATAGPATTTGPRVPTQPGIWLARITNPASPSKAVLVYIRNSSIVGVDRTW